MPTPPADDLWLTVRTCLTCLVIVAPLYLVMRFFIKLVRQAYGFDVPPEDEGPPLRICQSCHNTVLERDFSHCPYCGAALEAAADTDEPAAGAAS